MEVAGAHGIAGFLRKKIVVNKGLGGLAREFHHHSRRGIGVHIGVLARDVVAFGLDDFQEHVAGLGAASDASLVAICYIAFRHFLAGGVHELHFHAVLNLFNCHAFVAGDAYAVGYFLNEGFVFATLGLKHGFSDGGFDFFFIIAYHASVAFDDSLYHCVWWILL